MRKHLVLILVLLTLPALCRAGDGTIVATKENGRTVYVNNDTSPNDPPVRNSVLVYWSNKEHRWKKVPPPTPFAMRRARTAAAEVTQFVSTRPNVQQDSDAQQNPNYAGLTRGKAITSEQLDKVIEESAARNGVDPNLVRAIIKVESNFNPRAVSPKGAMGLMQLMPGTARSLNVSNPFDPQENVDAGVRHFKSLLDDFGGDLELSLAAYNAGAKAVQRSGGVPNYTETREYVRRITSIYGSNTTGTRVISSGGGARPLRVTRDSRGRIVVTNE